MGVYIPNMSKPKSCVMCGLYTDKFTDDEGFILECALGEYERANCPPIEIDLVKCRECKYSKNWYGDHRLCYLWAETGIGVFEDGYCYYGERKDDETD